MSLPQTDNDLDLPQDGGDLTALVGIWLNTDKTSNSLSRVIIESDEQALYRIQTFGIGSPDEIDWGWAAMDVHLGERLQCGFHATYQRNDITTHLVANHKLGVLVIELFVTFDDGSGRPGYIVREFLGQSSAPLSASQSTVCLTEPVQDCTLVQDCTPVDLTPFVGEWINSAESDQWLLRFSLCDDGNGWQLQIRTDELTPQPVAVTSYLDNMDYLAFNASITLADRQLIFAANTQKALVVMTTFVRFFDQGTLNRTYREIFIQHSEGKKHAN